MREADAPSRTIVSLLSFLPMNALQPPAMLGAKAALAVLGFLFSTTVLPGANASGAGQQASLAEELKWLQAEKLTVTTASLRSEPVDHAPATVRVMSERQIRDRGYQSLNEVLMDLPGVDVLDHTQAEGKNRVAFRGITGNNKFIILKDGIRINSPTAEPIMPIAENFALYDVKQVEILYGPASALYGADAFTGVVNLVTKAPTKNWTVDLQAEGGAFKTARFNVWLAKKLNDRVGFTAGGHYFETDGVDFTKEYPAEFPLDDILTFGDAVVVPKAKRAPFAGDSSSWGTTAKLQIGSGFTAGWNQSLFTDRITEGSPTRWSDYGTGARNNTLLATGYAKYQGELTDRCLVDVQASYSRYEQLPRSKFNNIYSNYADAYKYGFGERFQFEPRVTLDWSKHTFIGGLTLESTYAIPHTQDLSRRYDTSKSPSQQNQFHPGSNGLLPIKFYTASYWNIGGFAQIQSEWSDRLSTIAGLRFDYNEDYHETLNPRAGAIYNLADNTVLKALYGQAFLAPSPFVRYENFGSFGALGSPTTSFFYHLPNPALKPEKLQTGELSLTHKFSADFSASLAGYYTNAKNIIVRANAPASELAGFIPGAVIFSGEQEQNVGKSTAYGAELTVDYTLRAVEARWDLWGSFSVLDGSLTDQSTHTKYDLPFTSRRMLKIGATWNFRDYLVVTPSFNWTGRQSGFGPGSDVGSRGVMNLYAEWRTPSHGLTAFVRVTNVFDARYFNANGFGAISAPSPQDPRWVRAGVRLQF
jgi:outer membrane receptor protein involved in Fe transport